MISLIVGAIVIGAVACAPLLICFSRPTQRKPPETSHYYITMAVAGSSADIFDSQRQRICLFRLDLGLKVVRNIYRLFGRLAVVAGSTAEVALFYRNTIGKGGWIDFMAEKSSPSFSFLPGFLSRFQLKPQLADPDPVRILILGKISGYKCVIHFEDDTRLLWRADKQKLYTMSGLLTHEVVVISDSYTDASPIGKPTTTDYLVDVKPGLINPYLAVCICLYCLLLEDEKYNKTN